MLNSISSTWSSMWGSIKSACSSIWEGIKSAASNGINSVYRTVTSIKGKITGFFSGARKWLFNSGKSIPTAQSDWSCMSAIRLGDLGCLRAVSRTAFLPVLLPAKGRTSPGTGAYTTFGQGPIRLGAGHRLRHRHRGLSYQWRSMDTVWQVMPRDGPDRRPSAAYTLARVQRRIQTTPPPSSCLSSERIRQVDGNPQHRLERVSSAIAMRGRHTLAARGFCMIARRNRPHVSTCRVTKGLRDRLSPTVRLDETEVPGMDGTHVRATGLEPVEIAVDCNIVGGSLDEVAEARACACLRRCPAARRRLAASTTRLPSATCSRCHRGGAEQGRNAHMPNLTLGFYCADPAAYGQRRSEQVSASQRAVAAGGNYRAYPTVTGRPPAGSSWTITNVSTGRFVRVEASFTGAQTVVLDMRAERCTVNGADWPVTVASDSLRSTAAAINEH
ncbi:MAG: phage distal tail protein [Collinsella sp.]